MGIRAMVRLDLEVVQKITWRFEGYASTRRRAMYCRCRADTTQAIIAVGRRASSAARFLARYCRRGWHIYGRGWHIYGYCREEVGWRAGKQAAAGVMFRHWSLGEYADGMQSSNLGGDEGAAKSRVLWHMGSNAGHCLSWLRVEFLVVEDSDSWSRVQEADPQGEVDQVGWPR
jgi:hypothetical protein